MAEVKATEKGEGITLISKGIVKATKTPEVYTISATKVGSTAFTSDGVALKWGKVGLEACAPTWVNGKVSINHNYRDYGSIMASRFLENEVEMDVQVKNATLRKWLDVAGVLVGVSIEASEVVYDDMDYMITSARGTGVTFVFPPEFPACSLEEGCGIKDKATATVPEAGASADAPKSLVDNAEAEKVEATKEENSEVNNMTEEIEKMKADIEAMKVEKAKVEAENARLKEVSDKLIAKEKDAVLTVLATKMSKEVFEKMKTEPLCSLYTIQACVLDAEKVAKASIESNATATVKENIQIEQTEKAPEAQEYEANKAEYEALLKGKF